MNIAKRARAVLRVMEENYDITHFQYFYSEENEGNCVTMKLWTAPKSQNSVPLGALPQYLDNVIGGVVAQASWIFTGEGVQVSSVQKYTREEHLNKGRQGTNTMGSPNHSGKDDNQPTPYSGEEAGHGPSEGGSERSERDLGQDIEAESSNSPSPARKQRRTHGGRPPTSQDVIYEGREKPEASPDSEEVSYENISAPTSPGIIDSIPEIPDIEGITNSSIRAADIEDLLAQGRLQSMGRSSGGANRAQTAR